MKKHNTAVLKITLPLLMLIVSIYTIGALGATEVLYEDDEAFWALGSGGTGLIEGSIAEETTTVISGTSSLSYQVISGTKEWVNIQHGFLSPQDWSNYESLEFYWYGQNSGLSLQVLIESGTYTNRFSEYFVDNFSGWSKVSLPLSDFTQFNSASWSDVRKILIIYDSSTETQWYIDNLSLKGPSYKISTFTSGEGSIQLNPLGPYELNDPVIITASPGAGWMFDYWSGDLTGTTNPANINVNENKTILAYFKSQASIGVSTPASSYTTSSIVPIQITGGTNDREVMIQINEGTQATTPTPTNLRWADQKTLSSSGELTYSIKLPTTWPDATYTIRIKDIESGSFATWTFSIDSPTPPPPPPSGRVGRGGGGTMLPSAFIIGMMSPSDAEKLLDNFDPDDIAKVLQDVTDIEHVADIMELFGPSLASKVMEHLDPEYANELILLMDENFVSQLLLGFRAGHRELLEHMIAEDPTGFAIRIENTIKAQLSLPEEEKKAALERLGSAISEMDTQSIIELLIEISGLPETPEMAALLLESMPLGTTIDTVSEWISSENYVAALDNLLLILEKLTDDTLSNIYRGLTGENRITIYASLPSELIARLPEIGEYQISNLVAEPTEIETGESVKISYTLSNIGVQTDDFVIPLKINDITRETYTGILENGSSKDVEYSFTVDEEGTYTVQVDEEQVIFVVSEPETPPEPLTPAEFKVDGIEIVPSETEEGLDILVLITVSNIGESSGTDTISLLIDEVVYDSRDITLSGGQTNSVIFDVVADYNVGSHTVSSGEVSSTFEVQPSPSTTPRITTIVIVLMIVIGTVLVYLIRTGKLSTLFQT